MNPIQLPAFLTIAITLLLFALAANVGRQRLRYKIDGPATTGHPMLERAFRVQMNTIENTVMVLPLLWIAALFFNPFFATLAGLVWLGARIWYAIAYMKEPKRRGKAFVLSMLAVLALMIMGLWGLLYRVF